MHKLIVVRYAVATPMFCGGADYEKRAELRAQSFKGVLRWWWRALAWTRYGDLDTIRDHEDLLFGSSRTGQARLSIRVAAEADQRGADADLNEQNGRVMAGARYLGYGVIKALSSHAKWTSAMQLNRACLTAPFELEVSMRLRPTPQTRSGSRVDEDLLSDALSAVGLLGGIGAKSRKGYGSLALASLEGLGREWTSPATVEDLVDRIAAILPARSRVGGGSDGLPPYTAISSRTRVVVLDAGTPDPLVALDRIGCELVRYRSWGKDGKVLDGIDSEENFQGDHDLMRSESERDRHPERIAFGLPHNYGRGRSDKVGPADGGLDRRASPLLFHIHPIGDTTAVVAAFLPAVFLPEGRSGIKVGDSRVPLADTGTLYAPVHEFLDRLLDKGSASGDKRTRRKEQFVRALEVTLR